MLRNDGQTVTSMGKRSQHIPNHVSVNPQEFHDIFSTLGGCRSVYGLKCMEPTVVDLRWPCRFAWIHWPLAEQPRSVEDRSLCTRAHPCTVVVRCHTQVWGAIRVHGVRMSI